jgi:hypothetical protein
VEAASGIEANVAALSADRGRTGLGLRATYCHRPSDPNIGRPAIQHRPAYQGRAGQDLRRGGSRGREPETGGRRERRQGPNRHGGDGLDNNAS